MKINTHLTFAGNCREAMTFYKDCLGGDLSFQTIGDSPLSGKMPKKMRDCILHATLKKDNTLLMASDLVGDNGLQKGNSVSISLNCTSEAEIKQCYARLSNGGVQLHSLESNFWGNLFGDLMDKYGNHWILNFNRTKN